MNINDSIKTLSNGTLAKDRAVDPATEPGRQAQLRNGVRMADISKAGEYIRAKPGK